MSTPPALVYLEPDDEITTVVRRVRAAPPGRVVIVAPGRSRATSSAVALRLLARVAAEEQREIVIVGDALTRSLAAEAGLPAHGSIDEARAADIVAPAPAEPRHAAIHVVRGGDDGRTAPTMPVTPADSPSDEPARADETMPVAVARPPSASPARARGRRRPAGLAVVLGVAAALLVAAIAAGATLLPAATITIAPSSRPIVAEYELEITDVERRSGTVEASATVTATGSYEIVESARGTVTFRNFNVAAVDVPAGTLVAAGEQAFETTEGVAVPPGSLTSAGTILAGEAEAPVVAAAPGTDANVAAEAIDTVLSQGTAARLRGFPQNTARLVLNSEPASGGADSAGVLITASDVEAAVSELRAELERLAAQAVEADDSGDRIVMEPRPAMPELDVPDDLVGTRDPPPTRINGSLAWDVVSVMRDDIDRAAVEALAADGEVLPDRHELLPGSAVVSIERARVDADRVIVEVALVAQSAARPERDEILARSQGLTVPEAELSLADLGDASIELWPGWVETVPEFDWRVEVRIEAIDR